MQKELEKVQPASPVVLFASWPCTAFVTVYSEHTLGLARTGRDSTFTELRNWPRMCFTLYCTVLTCLQACPLGSGL